MKKIGILALQGDIAKHAQMVEQTGAQPVLVRFKNQLSEIDGLIIPGGESTTIGKLLVRFDLLSPLTDLISGGLPVFGTCAGLILLAKNIEGSTQPRIGLLDITVARNAYGRQIDSFETQIQAAFPVKEHNKPLCAVFIRAPIITGVHQGVEVLARHEDKPVLVKQGKLLGASFHPELTDDTRVHELFLDLI